MRAMCQVCSLDMEQKSGHSWVGGYWYYVKDGLGLDRRFCGRCCREWSVVE